MKCKPVTAVVPQWCLPEYPHLTLANIDWHGVSCGSKGVPLRVAVVVKRNVVPHEHDVLAGVAGERANPSGLKAPL